jgi:hypothetical protein
MDYVTRQFIVLTKKLRKEIRQGLQILHGDLQKHTESINIATDAHLQRSSFPPVIASELHIPQAVVDRIKAPNAEHEQRENHKMWIEAGTLFCVLVYVIFAGFQWFELNTSNINQAAATGAANSTAIEQIRLAQEQSKSLQKQFQLDERPCVGLNKARVEMGLHGGNPKAHFFFVNTGESAARNVRTRIDWKPPEYRFGIPSGCRDAKVPSMHAPYIVPQGSFELREPSIDPLFYETFRLNNWMKNYEGLMFIIACLVRSLTSAPTTHNTSLIFALPGKWARVMFGCTPTTMT